MHVPTPPFVGAVEASHVVLNTYALLAAATMKSLFYNPSPLPKPSPVAPSELSYFVGTDQVTPERVDT